MPRIGLTKERVIEAAAELIDRSGRAGFSLHYLAESLNVKTASLYNHIESMDELMTGVCAYALRAQWETEMTAIAGLSSSSAIRALAVAHRDFARAHRELYHLITETAVSRENQLTEASRCIVEPFLTVLSHTALTTKEKYHWQRVLRGIIHGFVSQEDAGFFSHLPVDVNESFQIAIDCFISGLAQAERRNAQ